jgi:methionyl-tRNA synthetase
MSKSKGNVVNPMEMAESYGVDAFRYFLMAEMSLGQDAGFTEEAFVRRYNADLANDLGNMLSRVMRLVTDHCDGKIPSPGVTGEDEAYLRDAVLAAAGNLVESVEEMRVDLGLSALAGAIRDANRYLEKRQPWTMAKKGQKEELGTVLYTAAEALRIVSGMLYPVMPGKMSELQTALGCSKEAVEFKNLRKWGYLAPGTRIAGMISLFPRIMDSDKKTARSQVPTGSAEKGRQASIPAPVAEGVAEVSYTDFSRVNLRTAKIIGADRVPGADKLLCLQIELGQEKRQIVAGIALHYSPEELVGKTVVVVANLQPAKIRGVVSNGMLLAASSGERLRLVSVDGDLPSGSPVK